jgi:hypothetical protein
MGEWESKNPWRQGHVLSDETSRALNLKIDDGELVAVVVSHDCDLAQPISAEPRVEVLLGRRIGAIDGSFSNLKSSRTLHLAFDAPAGAVAVELSAVRKVSVEKRVIADLNATPTTALTLSGRARTLLQHWLAARYRRSAFADSFNDRLRDSGLHSKIVQILKPTQAHVYAIFFDVDNGEEVERADEYDVHTLEMYLLYNTTVDPEIAERETETAAAKIEEAFKNALHDPEKGWRQIQFNGCSALADSALTFRDSIELKKWDVEHISFRAGSGVIAS